MDTYKLNFTILDLEMISFLCMKAGEKLSQRDIAKALDVSPTAVANSIKNLLSKGYVKLEKTKTINFISFNRDNPKALELKRIENQRQIYLSGLSDFLEEQFPATTIILFGSYSRGEDVKQSDVDLAIIGGKDKDIDLERFEKILNREININFYRSWNGIHKHLKNNILGGIILHGVIDL